MYSAATGMKQWVSILGGAHCKFTDNSTICDLISAGGSVTRDFQIRTIDVDVRLIPVTGPRGTRAMGEIMNDYYDVVTRVRFALMPSINDTAMPAFPARPWIHYSSRVR